VLFFVFRVLCCLGILSISGVCNEDKNEYLRVVQARKGGRERVEGKCEIQRIT